MNTASIRFTRVCVPGFGLDREPVAIRTCARLRWRAHSDITLTGLNRTRTPPATQSAAYLPLPTGSGKLRTAIERTNSLVVLAVRPFISRGQQLICNLRWPFKASSSLSSGSFVKHRQEPASVQNVLLCENHLSLFAAAHGTTMQQGASENAETCSGEIQNVFR